MSDVRRPTLQAYECECSSPSCHNFHGLLQLTFRLAVKERKLHLLFPSNQWRIPNIKLLYAEVLEDRNNAGLQALQGQIRGPYGTPTGPWIYSYAIASNPACNALCRILSTCILFTRRSTKLQTIGIVAGPLCLADLFRREKVLSCRHSRTTTLLRVKIGNRYASDLS